MRMTIFLPITFMHREMIFVFPCSLAKTTDEIDHPWCISSPGDFLGVLSSNFSIIRSMRRYPMREQCGTITVL